MKTDKEKSNDNYPKARSLSSGVNWEVVIMDTLCVGVGILSTTPVVTNTFYRGLWRYFILLGIATILWGFYSGNRK